MPTINDYKKTALKNLGYTGSLSDAEGKYLKGLVSPYKGSIPDMWRKYLVSLGYSGSNPEMMYQYLGSLGYTGPLTSRLFKFWKDGGAPLWAAGTDYWEDFTNTNGNLPAITDTHAQTIRAANLAGTYSPFTANVLVRTDAGLQTVPTRTNSIRNNSMVGASAPSTAPTNWALVQQTGYTWSVVETGSEFGLTYCDFRLVGTDATVRDHSIQFEGNSQIVAANAEVWTESVYARIVGGSLTGVTDVRLVIDENTSAGVFVASGTSVIVPSATFTRFTFTRTLAGGGTVARVQPMFRVKSTGGGTVDVTIRIYAPQMELGAFASSPIITTTAAVAVTGNVQAIGNLGTQLATGVAGLIRLVDLQVGSATSERLLEFDDGTSNNRIILIQTATVIRLGITAGGVTQATIDDTYTPGIGTDLTIAFAASTNFANMRIVGRSALTADTSVTWPVMDRMGIGGSGVSANTNSYMVTKRLALDFGPQDATTFAAMFAKAQLAAV